MWTPLTSRRQRPRRAHTSAKITQAFQGKVDLYQGTTHIRPCNALYTLYGQERVLSQLTWTS